ncbi:ArsR/SmtB family transcription factor [Gordonia terrae]|uniref:ArsR family transcriptional regulator n=2 Tax=Gordonia terrae TaxID=2055 RepID=A0AAD0K6Y7_9ACTN|nr:MULTISPECIES: metalloregulator ArsR/SmtB family transcription factor [Gordonia]ANY21913.1 transcriptional regulator [Gordonia terrae]AWO82650.1 ArsR family transcriptional regulator [Gordonia terrae]GAB45245.1 putative ArsR family transcriptional regulator [Gordonia terrae NBRC 100016]
MDEFEVIADPVRRALIERLARGPARVVDLAADHPISRPAISRHLRVLGEAGMTTVVDQGRERHYELVPGALAPVRAWLDAVDSEVVEPRFDDRHLDALDLEVRRTVRERGQRDAEADSLDSASTQQDSASRHKETG